MAWGTVTVGGIVFRETFTLTDDGGSLKLSGQEAHPPLTLADVRARHLNVLGLRGEVVPVVFSDKSLANGFFQVTDASSDLFSFSGGSVLTASWSMTLARLGTERDVEFESRVPTIARSTELTGVTPSFWHAPPPDTIDYYTGATVPSATTTRVSVDGNVTVYRGIPANVAPRWTVPAASYDEASARVLLDGARIRGEDTPPFTTWEINNGLVRVTGGSDATVTVALWDSGAWRSLKGYVPTVNGTSLTGAPGFTILRNDPEEVTVRLSYPQSPGRVTVDVGLRRGSRFVTGVIKRHASATLGVTRTAAEAATTTTGGMYATAVDADGNRFHLGSSRTVTATTATASIAKAGVTSFDFFIGGEIGPVLGGDTFTDIVSQYLGTSGDRTRLVRR